MGGKIYILVEKKKLAGSVLGHTLFQILNLGWNGKVQQLIYIFLCVDNKKLIYLTLSTGYQLFHKQISSGIYFLFALKPWIYKRAID